MYNSKQEFSTGADGRQSRGYSSRFSKNKSRNIYNKDILPFYQEKAAIIIQKFWRHKMCMRRLYYQNLYEEIYFYNQALSTIVNIKKQYLKGIQTQVKTLQKINTYKVQNQTKQIRAYMKNLAKQCVGLAFKMQKQMLSEEQLKSLLEEKVKSQQRIELLKKQKQEIRNQIIGKLGQREQTLLHQIKQANSLLLQAVSEKNTIKHKLRERAVNGSTIFQFQ